MTTDSELEKAWKSFKKLNAERLEALQKQEPKAPPAVDDIHTVAAQMREALDYACDIKRLAELSGGRQIAQLALQQKQAAQAYDKFMEGK